MKAETVINFLKLKKFEQYKFKSELMNQFEDQNIDIWANDTRLIMLKEYRTQNSLLDWELEDQVCIANSLHYIPNKYINNLYFFMILDFNADDVPSRLMKNKTEKNDLICKKYILQLESDFNRIPFLMNINLESNAFSFDLEFRKRIMNFNGDTNKENNLNLEKLMNDYFNNYLNDKKTIKIKIDNLLEIGD